MLEILFAPFVEQIHKVVQKLQRNAVRLGRGPPELARHLAGDPRERVRRAVVPLRRTISISPRRMGQALQVTDQKLRQQDTLVVYPTGVHAKHILRAVLSATVVFLEFRDAQERLGQPCRNRYRSHRRP